MELQNKTPQAEKNPKELRHNSLIKEGWVKVPQGYSLGSKETVILRFLEDGDILIERNRVVIFVCECRSSNELNDILAVLNIKK